MQLMYIFVLQWISMLRMFFLFHGFFFFVLT